MNRNFGIQRTFSLADLLCIFSVVMVSFVVAGPAQAATIVPSSYSYNTSIDWGSGNESLPPTLLNDDVIPTGAWGAGGYVGFGDAGTNAWASITFTFDDTYSFDSVDLYSNDTFNAGYAEISTSTDNLTFTSPTQYILTNAAMGGGSHAVTDSLDVTALADAQYIKIEWFKTTAYPGAGNWVFLNEVDFAGDSPAPAAPEPSTAILALIGLMGTCFRRRK